MYIRKSRCSISSLLWCLCIFNKKVGISRPFLPTAPSFLPFLFQRAKLWPPPSPHDTPVAPFFIWGWWCRNVSKARIRGLDQDGFWFNDNHLVLLPSPRHLPLPPLYLRPPPTSCLLANKTLWGLGRGVDFLGVMGFVELLSLTLLTLFSSLNSFSTTLIFFRSVSKVTFFFLFLFFFLPLALYPMNSL